MNNWNGLWFGMAIVCWATVARSDDLTQGSTQNAGGSASTTAATVGDVLPESEPSLDSSASETKVDEELYPTGELKVRKVVAPNAAGTYVRNGAWKMWDKLGNPISEGHYKDDIRDGQWMRVHEALAPNFDLLTSDVAMVFAEASFNSFKMPFTSRASFKEGKLHGTWTLTDASNRVIYKWTYIDGKRDGAAVWYHNNGSKMAEMAFRDGVLDGPRRHFDENGNVTKDETWFAGRMLALQTEYHDEAKTKVKSEGYYLSDGYQIHTPDDWWQGRAATYAKVPGGKPELNGELVTYYETGEKESAGLYRYNQRQGTFKWWFSSGKLSAEGSYKNDKLNGPWVWYHANGEIQSKGAYEMGKPIGLWMKWTDDGGLKMKKDFAGGRAEIVSTPVEEKESVLKSASLIPLGEGKIR